MKLQLNKKNLKNLSKDAQILPSDMTPNVAGGGVSDEVASCDCSVITRDVFCGATGSCGCDSAGGACTNTNTCM